MKHWFGISILLGIAAAVSAPAQETGPQQALRWERAKDAAAARQARLDTQHAGKPAEADKTPLKVLSEEHAAVPKTGDTCPEEGILWERAKDHPDAQQVKTEGQHTASVAAKPKTK